MTVEPLLPDVPVGGAMPPASGFLRAVADAEASFARAAQAEADFAHGRGGLLAMTIDRAQADVVLSVASAAASRCASALGAVFNMQV